MLAAVPASIANFVPDDAEGEVEGSRVSYSASRKYAGYGCGRVDSGGHGVLTGGDRETLARLALLAKVFTKSDVSFWVFVPGSSTIFVGCDGVGLEEKGFSGGFAPVESGFKLGLCRVSFGEKMLPPTFIVEFDGGWMAFTRGVVDFC